MVSCMENYNSTHAINKLVDVYMVKVRTVCVRNYDA